MRLRIYHLLRGNRLEKVSLPLGQNCGSFIIRANFLSGSFFSLQSLYATVLSKTIEYVKNSIRMSTGAVVDVLIQC